MINFGDDRLPQRFWDKVSVNDETGCDDARLLDLWLKTKRSTNTKRAYRSDLERFFGYVNKGVRQVTLEDIVEYGEALDGSQATIRRKLATVKSFLTFAANLRYVPFNVGLAVPLPRIEDNLSARIVSEQDIERLIESGRTQRDRVVLRLIYSAGLRIGSACRLRVDDITEREKHNAVQIHVVDKAGERDVILSPFCSAQLRDFIESRQGWVFTGRDPRKHIHPNTVRRLIKRAAVKAGVTEDITPHWLRHSHVSHALDRGAPAHLVRETVGHKSLNTTTKYAHARPDDSSSNYLVR